MPQEPAQWLGLGDQKQFPVAAVRRVSRNFRCQWWNPEIKYQLSPQQLRLIIWHSIHGFLITVNNFGTSYVQRDHRYWSRRTWYYSTWRKFVAKILPSKSLYVHKLRIVSSIRAHSLVDIGICINKMFDFWLEFALWWSILTFDLQINLFGILSSNFSYGGGRVRNFELMFINVHEFYTAI
jgi:hypothetical protein